MTDVPRELAVLLETASAVLFDFDGVVVDSEPLHYEAYRVAFAARGHALNAAEYWSRFTDTGAAVQAEMEVYGLDFDEAEIRAEKKQTFGQLCREGAIPFAAGALETLRAFADSALPASIASNSAPDDIAAIFAAAGETCPLPIVGRSAGLRGKPAPDIFLAAAETLGLSAADRARCVVLEDARKGVEAAVAAGMIPVVVRGATNRDFAYPEARAEIDGIAAAGRALGAIR